MKFLLSVSALLMLTSCGSGKCYYTEMASPRNAGERVFKSHGSHSWIMDGAIETAKSEGHCFVVTYDAPVFESAHDSAVVWYYGRPSRDNERIVVNHVTRNHNDVKTYPSQYNVWVSLYSLSNDRKSLSYRMKVGNRPIYVCLLVRCDDRIVLRNLPSEKTDTMDYTSEFVDSLESHVPRYCLPTNY